MSALLQFAMAAVGTGLIGFGLSLNPSTQFGIFIMSVALMPIQYMRRL